MPITVRSGGTSAGGLAPECLHPGKAVIGTDVEPRRLSQSRTSSSGGF
jgi:hypothetical protein